MKEPSETSGSRPSAASFIVGGGESGRHARSLDWSKTSLGPVEHWPQSLRTVFNICLSSRFPIAIYWGPDYAMLYNDSLIPMVGANKHPHAMGRPALEVLAEIRSIIEPLFKQVWSTGEATLSEDLMLPLVRHENAPEESYFTFTYSPIRVESGEVGAVLCEVIETTEKVIEERRLRLLNSLAEAAQVATKEEACALAASQIARFTNDVPFCLLYLFDEPTRVATLVGSANIDAASELAPQSIAFGAPSAWRIEDALGAREPLVVDLPVEVAGTRSAAILPIERSGGGRALGFMVAGLSPLLRRGPSYRRFHNLLASSLSQAVSNAAAYAEQKKRAEELAELDRAKTTFFSNVSHEFRTPLTLMLAPIQDMVQAPTGAPIDHAAVALLQRNANRLLKLVNTLLDFSRIEAGRVEAVYEAVDLAALTIDLASSFRAAIEGAGLRFTVACDSSPELVSVDRDMWEKIVLNLLSNAFKFTFEGEIAVRLRIEGESAVLEVEDTGTGVAEAEIPRLFDRFHRIEGAKSRSHEGSGIGLALIRELVNLHGGAIDVVSKLGVGTKFTIRIPRTRADRPSPTAARNRARTTIGADVFVDEARRWSNPNDTGTIADAPPSVSGDRERIVFADDNADMREYVTRLLRERWNVEAFADGAAALTAIRRDPPALVLTDVMMPGLDGFALLRELRADATLRGVPVILLSARAGEEESAKGRSAGASDYIAKPFSARDLLVRVASSLAAAKSAREMALLEERQRQNFYRHFMQAPFPVAVLKGPEHVVELANPAILKAWGVKKENAIGKPLVVAVPELKDQRFPALLDAVFASGVTYEGREELVRVPTGTNRALEDFYFNYVYAALRDPSDAVEGVLVSAFDVTERVRSRIQLEETLEGLREATIEREEALGVARRANLAKDEFLATMSHELRTPLNAMVGWANLLRNGTVTGDQVPRALETIERNARMQAHLIEDMLDFARIEQGKLVLSVGPTEMVKVVEAAIDSLRPAANAKNIRLQSVLDSHATIVGDPDRLQQVVWNLLSNAIKFTAKGGRVLITLHRKQSYVELMVSDDGAGITPDFLPHVFDRFRQADAKTTRRVGGLGLGLAIVRSIVELHGGTVAAASDGEGKGASFTVRLPTAPLRAESAEPKSSRAENPTSFECPPGLADLRVLVVDDEIETRELLRYLLEQCKSAITLAGSANEALRLLGEQEFDLLVSDVGMPDLDGHALIREVRKLANKNAARIPAIALTAYAQSEDRTAAMRAGFDMHLTKPIDPSELLVVISTLVESTKRRSAP